MLEPNVMRHSPTNTIHHAGLPNILYAALVARDPADDLGRCPVVFAQEWWGKGFETAAPEKGGRPAGAFTY